MGSPMNEHATRTELTETEAQVFEVVRDGTVFRFGRELLRMSLIASENGSAAKH